MAEPRVLALAWIAVSEAALCLGEHCGVVFLQREACPRCAGRTWTPLHPVLREGTGRALPDCSDPLISFRAVEDCVANGLAPARLRVEGLARVLTLLVDLDLIALAGIHDRAATVAQSVCVCIDETLARLRALGPARRGALPVAHGDGAESAAVRVP